MASSPFFEIPNDLAWRPAPYLLQQRARQLTTLTAEIESQGRLVAAALAFLAVIHSISTMCCVGTVVSFGLHIVIELDLGALLQARRALRKIEHSREWWFEGDDASGNGRHAS
eukprot:243919-Pleurochrysis_carterae.AAC.1